jgi:hypothetical protein
MLRAFSRVSYRIATDSGRESTGEMVVLTFDVSVQSLQDTEWFAWVFALRGYATRQRLRKLQPVATATRWRSLTCCPLRAVVMPEP